jgi:imidazolonepropionase-like amidohydrolase
MTIHKAILGLLAATALVLPARAAESTRYVLEPDAVWSAGDAAPHAGWAVVVENGKIAAVGPKSSLARPSGAVLIALPGQTLIPGLIELH